MADLDYRPTVEEYGKTIKGREDHIRESWIRCMEARIVRENLQKCYYFEGVNHYANCKDLADKYAKMIRDNKVIDEE
ncbi:NADH-ubiquinone oxidoreductase 12 kDa subunit [Trichosporon asahii var. asahii CBS 8904]|uniref:NADH-ubiquinone oxidoreductase 12 kDa subunit n=2 Tax=Trichosporon asahii var. asahii TaxID=189963 RepID=K1W763_TRIAC|nr:NADH-ubiquinone oxidoreductase 12 kDa subunit, precursor [Trichosporon asahii var. asahii CBS 2479]EJT48771.1 NADH-ubiquinone oxidoreductase 12 kDa subunit, precursor [Trichosporon asahii var. asahii CBS 2479]EKC97548.1 NADH-ubiquinone oxidoreductase 12 kDa subunit [Trichosporon asahii var. asahii CBS 8904]